MTLEVFTLDGMIKTMTKTHQTLIVLILAAILLVLSLDKFSPKEPPQRTPIETMSIDEHLRAVDSMNRYVVNPLYFALDSIAELKQKVITKYKTYYIRIGIDSTLTSEVLYNHTLLDDSTVSYPFNDMVQFRLIQGLEYRGLYNLSKVENNVLKTIIDTKNEVIDQDADLIILLHKENERLVDTFNTNQSYISLLEDDHHMRVKQNNKLKVVAWSLVGAFLFALGVR